MERAYADTLPCLSDSGTKGRWSYRTIREISTGDRMAPYTVAVLSKAQYHISLWQYFESHVLPVGHA
eukprot:3162523-Rhodomonas_salina.1